MNIEWGSYPSNIGHASETYGCFRCHNEDLTDDDGESIGYDCDLCHSILAEEEKEPYEFLLVPDTLNPIYQQHKYLQQEILCSHVE
jgi:hypothetical protein